MVLLLTGEVLAMALSLRYFRKLQITLVSLLPCRCLTRPAGSCHGDSQKVSASKEERGPQGEDSRRRQGAEEEERCGRAVRAVLSNSVTGCAVAPNEKAMVL